MASLDSSGSQWRRWDLHVHVPGTHLTNNYRATTSNESVEDLFCRMIHESEVEAFGITDYFDAARIVEFIALYKERYPESNKLLLPNVELRLTEVLNKDDHFVNLHLVFNPSIAPERIVEFVRRIRVEITVDGRQIECGELNGDQYSRATVDRHALMEHAKSFFGANDTLDSKFLIIVPSGNDGMRPQQGVARREQLAWEIEGGVDAIFGNARDREWYLKTDRNSRHSRAMPVFRGSDARSFEDLAAQHNDAGIGNFTTWIKANLSYEGLLQTLLEPSERVRISDARPDIKDGFKWIKRVKFRRGASFPEVVLLNENLTSIIGSRSSGKSALLAHIAHAVQPGPTERQMSEIGLSGPAPGVTWQSAEGERCEIEWSQPETERGKVIYVPQNALFALSGRPAEITSKIRPAIDERFPIHRSAILQYERSLQDAEQTIRDAVANWFECRAAGAAASEVAAQIGDKVGMLARVDALTAIIEGRTSDVAPEQVLIYTAKLQELDARRQATNRDREALQALGTVTAAIQTEPSAEMMPKSLADAVAALIEATQGELEQSFAALVDVCAKQVDGERELIGRDATQLQVDYADVVAAVAASNAAQNALDEKRALEEGLDRIDVELAKAEAFAVDCQMAIAEIESALSRIRVEEESLLAVFLASTVDMDDMTITAELEFATDAAEVASAGVNKSQNSPFIVRREGVDFLNAAERPKDFLESLSTGTTVLNAGVQARDVATIVLLIHKELRLSATLDGDTIGGFRPSSMTPGKQALFALTLLLGEDSTGWPLLLDQPEDDLDSRSIYGQLVPYLNLRKRERQIIMVSHNANLVVGADSECVIVANRHGSDRPNHRSRVFDYRSGALEDSFDRPDAPTTLDRLGIREHVCHLLDGGPDAFRRRSKKYRLA